MRDPYAANARYSKQKKLEDTGESYFSLEKQTKSGACKKRILSFKSTQKRYIHRARIQNFVRRPFCYTNCILQITVSKNHSVKQAEPVKIISNMPAYKSDQNADIRLYFVVPDDIYNTFECQDYTTKDNTSKEDRQVKRINSTLDNVEQWAIKVQINPILEGLDNGNRSKSRRVIISKS
ncbi:7737_t:CDS:2 [Funneliformis geosporum]|uniref:7737_t:CDS:1 n=1 Tax=Funneliformis geosporum TaxID=1117311 RepID=A0A9W4SU17_9GLOM|nr:7737_t:CDS:2 [Funneliformis geosporum]